MPKEIREDLNEWKDILYLWVERLNIVKIVLPKLVYRFDAIPMKILVFVFSKWKKSILKFIGKCQGPRITTIIFNKEQSWKICTSLL